MDWGLKETSLRLRIRMWGTWCLRCSRVLHGHRVSKISGVVSICNPSPKYQNPKSQWEECSELLSPRIETSGSRV